jgi:hypothetical protein
MKFSAVLGGKRGEVVLANKTRYWKWYKYIDPYHVIEKKCR